MAIFVGFGTLHAANVKIKKIIYSQNIIYEGEAIKSGGAWIPQGEGVLYFSKENIFLPYLNPSVTYFRLSGIFNDKEVVSASLSTVEKKEISTRYVVGTYMPPKNGGVMIGRKITNPTAVLYNDKDNVYKGDLSYSIDSDGKLYYGNIKITFEKGMLLGGLEISNPIDVHYGHGVDMDNEGIDFSASATTCYEIELFDPIQFNRGVKYDAQVSGKLFVESEKIYADVNTEKIVWKDGCYAELKHYEKGRYVTYANYGDKGFAVYSVNLPEYPKYECPFSLKLNDGTIVSGEHEHGTPYIKLIKCTDGRIFKGKEKPGATIKGGENLNLLLKSKTLTKEDVTFVNGFLFDEEGEEVDEFINGRGKAGEFPRF